MAKKQPEKNKRGFVLPLVITMVVLLFVVGLGLLRLGLSARVQAVRNTAEMSARAAADAGLTKAVFEMNQNLNVKPWDFSNITSAVNIELPNANADYTYTIEEIVADTEYRVTSIGRSGHAERTVYCNLVIESSIFDHAVFADGDITLSNEAKIDGYDSEIGLYGGTNVQSSSLGTNSTANKAIDLANRSQIIGDVIIGPDGNPSSVVHRTGLTTITGDTYVNSEEKEFPEVTAPILTDKGDKPTGTISTSGKYDEINLTNSSVLSVVGDVVLHITEDVMIDNGATLAITEGSSLVLYVGGNLKSSNAGTINNLTKIPSNCQIYSTANGEVDYVFDNASNVYASVYAPKAKIEVTNQCNIFGAIVGGSVKIDNDAQIHWDQALRRASVLDSDLTTEFVISSWRE